MARGRMISKAISLDEKVNALSDDTCRLLFTWLIPHLDCEGRMHGDPITVKSIVFPRRNISTPKVEKYLKELEKTELILRYFVNGNQYLSAPNFEKHQVGLRKSQESASQIPSFTTELKRDGSVLAPTQIKIKEEIKDNKENNKRKYGEFQNVLLTDEEYQKLKDRFGAEVKALIENISSYLASSGKRYKSHYATILNWSRRDKESGKVKGRGLLKDYPDSPDYNDI